MKTPHNEVIMSSGFLFPEPSPWFGAGRLLDLWGTLDTYNRSWAPDEADARALYSDWRMVGQDLEAVMGPVISALQDVAERFSLDVEAAVQRAQLDPKVRQELEGALERVITRFPGVRLKLPQPR